MSHQPRAQFSHNRYPGCWLLAHPARVTTHRSVDSTFSSSQPITASLKRSTSSRTHSSMGMQPPSRGPRRGCAWEITDNRMGRWEGEQSRKMLTKNNGMRVDERFIDRLMTVSTSVVSSNHFLRMSPVFPVGSHGPSLPLPASEVWLRNTGSCQGFSGRTGDSSLLLYHWTNFRGQGHLGIARLG